jgi:hypothetical protein
MVKTTTPIKLFIRTTFRFILDWILIMCLLLLVTVIEINVETKNESFSFGPKNEII